MKERNAPLWVKLFVPFHLVAITAWALPWAPEQYLGHPPATKLAIRTDSVTDLVQSSAEYARTEILLGNQLYLKDSPLKFYLLSTGFWQYWDMFAPNPSNVDVYADADITYADGSKRHVQYPRMFTLSLGQKFLKERFRKFFERAGSDAMQFRYLRPVFAERLALVNFDDPKNPPTKVELHRHTMTINPPGVAPSRGYADTLFYTYYFGPTAIAKLKQEKGF